MIDLNQLAKRFQHRVPVQIEGCVVHVVPSSAALSNAIREALPQPRPTKTRKDPTRGSLAPQIPDTEDPAYLRAFDAWLDRVTVAEIAFGLVKGGDVADLPPPPEDMKDRAAFASWCDACAKIISASFSSLEFSLLSRAVMSAQQPAAHEVAEGN
jgi:hypothetical protein